MKATVAWHLRHFLMIVANLEGKNIHVKKGLSKLQILANHCSSMIHLCPGRSIDGNIYLHMVEKKTRQLLSKTLHGTQKTQSTYMGQPPFGCFLTKAYNFS